jgi:hypothetical protein
MKHGDDEPVERQLPDGDVAREKRTQARKNVDALHVQRRSLQARFADANVGAREGGREQRDADAPDRDRLPERSRQASLYTCAEVTSLQRPKKQPDYRHRDDSDGRHSYEDSPDATTHRVRLADPCGVRTPVQKPADARLLSVVPLKQKDFHSLRLPSPVARDRAPSAATRHRAHRPPPASAVRINGHLRRVSSPLSTRSM